jgi:hypothetical protein
MDKISTARQCIENLNERSTSIFLLLLLLGDLTFIVLHLVNSLTPLLRYELLNLWVDHGYPEMYQYIKFIWITILFLKLSLKNVSLHYVAWAGVFTYFLFDDSLQIHEKIGGYIAAKFNFVPLFGLRLQDFGELAVSAAAGIILLLALVWAYMKGSQMFRKVSQDFIFLVLILIFFGVFVDMAQQAINLGPVVSYILGIIEDGGEMLSVSLILWYAFLINIRDDDTGISLCDCIRIALTRRSILP